MSHFSSYDSTTLQEVKYITIGHNHEQQRLDNFLRRQFKGVAHAHLQRLIRSGQVRVNGGRKVGHYNLQIGDLVRLPPLRVVQSEHRNVPLNQAKALLLPVLYEDNVLLAIDKPAGIAVHGGSGISLGVIEALRIQRSKLDFLELVHRLDRETSGVLLLAKRRSALTKLQTAWREHGPQKTYIALVLGVPEHETMVFKQALLREDHAQGEVRVRVDEKLGQYAHTIAKLRQTFSSAWGELSLLEVYLLTGRTHQIRVHLSTAGLPIVGDHKYGNFQLNHHIARTTQSHAPAQLQKKLTRMFLHATRLQIEHPLTQIPLRIESPLPQACRQWLATLTAQTTV